MDLVKIGRFLSELRHEHGYTQEKLGEILGVSNKTISRWENGNYLPPVEMLQLLSQQYSVSINEILSGQRLDSADYMEKAEENLKETLSQSAFSLKERIEYFKHKWLKEHVMYIILCCLVFIAVIIGGIVLYHRLHILAVIIAFAFYLVSYNMMMAYVEQHAYTMSDGQE